MAAPALAQAPAQRATERSVQKQTAEAERAALRERLATLKRAISRTETEKTRAADSLAVSEEAISDANRALRDLAGEQAETRQRLAELERQRQELMRTVDAGKRQLARLLREQYVAGNEDRIKLLLSGENPNRINRDLQLFGYVSQAQARLIDTLKQNLLGVEANQAAMLNAKQELDEIAQEQREARGVLEREKNNRNTLLAELSDKLSSQRKEAGNVARDEERLSGLVSQLARLIEQQRRAELAAAEQRRRAELALAERRRQQRALEAAHLAREKAAAREALRLAQRAAAREAQKQAQREAQQTAQRNAQNQARGQADKNRPAVNPDAIEDDVNPAETAAGNAALAAAREKERAAERAVERAAELAARRATEEAEQAAELKPEAAPKKAFFPASFAALRGQLHMPLQGDLVARFGSRRGDGPTWKGLFIKASEGADVKAVAGGRVVFAEWLRGFGNLIIVDHGGEYLSIYGNNQAVLKRPGDPVRSGDTIASAGNSGGNEQSGLYFEMRHQGRAFDPLGWVTTR